MVKLNNPNPYGSLSEDRLHNFENVLGCKLPLEYRFFLLKYNGGSPEPGGFWIISGADGSKVRLFYGLHHGPKWLSIDYQFTEFYGVPDGMLAIGDDGVGNLLCLGITDEFCGNIYFLDHEIHPLDSPNSMEGVYKLATSFTSFLESLTHL